MFNKQSFLNQPISQENIRSNYEIARPTREMYLNSFNYTDIFTREMAEYSYDRTEKHTKRVVKNVELLLEQADLKTLFNLSKDGFEKFKEKLIERAKSHDVSKLVHPEAEWYVYINCKDKEEYGVCLDSVKKEGIDCAIQHHWGFNKHHPEYYFIKKDGQLETDKSIIQERLKNMSDADLVEMVSDWFAMSQEFNTNPVQFFNNNVGLDKRWPFPPDKKEKIFKLIKMLQLAHKNESVPSLKNEENNSTASHIEHKDLTGANNHLIENSFFKKNIKSMATNQRTGQGEHCENVEELAIGIVR
ncbi:uncharacterized protein RVIR1_03330 [Candidatus Rickettsiella viridis]|uniref:Uncharacterized protein n=1 Tax=Candidatus Rickettsiella viridis TaxID=676208 RepID=A0A2Z5UTS9_9COXI|nr:DUF5662 family protein [Candidatus Rickettsiella viridis]BBB14854.1 uncharacterized protein RVIR1_03330 [Candidatus Rickettsiella viridis]